MIYIVDYRRAVGRLGGPTSLLAAMTAASRATNKHDVEIERLRVHGETFRALANRGGTAMVFAASALPVWMFQGVITPLAGRTTHVDAAFVFSAAISISAAIHGAQVALALSRKKELRRLRSRVSELEASLIRVVVQ